MAIMSTWPIKRTAYTKPRKFTRDRVSPCVSSHTTTSRSFSMSEPITDWAFALLQLPTSSNPPQAYTDGKWVFKGPLQGDRGEYMLQRYQILRTLDPHAVEAELVHINGPAGVFVNEKGDFPLSRANFLRIPFLGDASALASTPGFIRQTKMLHRAPEGFTAGHLVVIPPGVRVGGDWERELKPKFPQLVRAAMARFIVGAGDICARNFVLTPDGVFHQIDLEKSVASGLCGRNLVECTLTKMPHKASMASLLSDPSSDAAMEAAQVLRDAERLAPEWPEDYVARFRFLCGLVSRRSSGIKKAAMVPIIAPIVGKRAAAETPTLDKQAHSECVEAVVRDEPSGGERKKVRRMPQLKALTGPPGTKALLQELPNYALPDLSTLPVGPEGTAGVFMVAGMGLWRLCFESSKTQRFVVTRLQTSLLTSCLEELSFQSLLWVGPRVMRAILEIETCSFKVDGDEAMAEVGVQVAALLGRM